MKRAFIRGLWGVEKDFWEKHTDSDFKFSQKFTYDKKNGCSVRRYNLNQTIESNINDIDKNTCHTYIFGKDNHDYFSKFGIRSTLIHDEPYKYDPVKRHWMHKIEILKTAMNDYDEIVWLDWDCKLQKPIDNNFWIELNKKASFQAALRRYGHRQCNLRKVNCWNKMLPNGGFVYIRDKNIPSELLKFESWTDEILYARYTDSIMGGFNIDKYFELFEPTVAHVKKTVYPNKKYDFYFLHT